MQNATNKKTVLIGMSGGVDSSVAALLLKKDYNVIGLFMNNWEERDENGHCPAESDYEDVKLVCSKLNIPYYSVNFAKQYLDRVFAHFLAEYRAFRTPNPDVLCNREIKFAALSEYALKLGADYVATGHYAGVGKEGGKFTLLKATDKNKDQSYFLHQFTQAQLKNTLFPLYPYKKPEVRRIAEEHGLITAKKKDSTGICFIGERKFREFLKTYIPAQPGIITDEHGKQVGNHEGLMYYTLGQRRGLGIGGVPGEENSRWFVVDKNVKENTLIVSCGEETGGALYSSSLTATNLTWVASAPPAQTFTATVKTRYRQPDQPAVVTVIDNVNSPVPMTIGDRVRIDFETPQRAVTPGQYAVIYAGEICLGGGVIE